MRHRRPLLIALLACCVHPASARAQALPEAGVRAWQVGLLRPDRLQHASLSATCALALSLVTRRPAAGAAGALVLGLGKELWDRHRSGFDPVDLTADAVGAGLGALAGAAIDR